MTRVQHPRKKEKTSSETTSSWQSSLKSAFRDSAELAEFLELPPEPSALATGEDCLPPEPSALAVGGAGTEFEICRKSKPVASAIGSGNSLAFPLFVTREFAGRMRKADWNDPLLKQVWIDPKEEIATPGFVSDPVGDSKVEQAPGLLHKYHGRVLLVTTGACAIHCRYCFRRHYPYSSAPKSIDEWEPAFVAIEKDSSIEEVILSGGDPLSIVDTVLSQLLERLERIPHLKRLRIHTRIPVVIPSRITSSLLEMLADSRLSKWIVLHINHANEIDDEVFEAVKRLRKSGAVLLNQSVLLRDVNDDIESLVKLSERLLEASVLPYYLHQLDPVQSAAHFEVPITDGKQLIVAMAKRLPGFAVPKYVYEKSGEPNKTLIY
ncbi:MAG: EF-P beta-lysylation protein EpmB [Planctomycetota bacterium]|nr:EF-P beta-lysylation protein EpmB [Planctomycetota bacterium]